MLWAALDFPSLPPGSLEPLAAWACQFTPKVSLEPPQALLLEVQGSLRLFGGEEPLKHRLAAELAELHYPFSLAFAATARAALWIARGQGEPLEALPLAATGLETEFLRSIGVRTVGELLRLPREGLARRCGERVVCELDQAFGVAPEPRAFFAPPPRFSAKLELPAEVEHAEGLVFGARRLLVQLEGLLTARHEGIRSFVLALMHREGSTPVEVGLASPARDAERLAQLLRERLAGLNLRQPVQAIGIEAGSFTPLPGASRSMFGDPAADAEGWARLAERLRARFGHDAVHGLATQPDHRPEHAWRRIEPGEWDPREFRQPGPRPVWLLDSARRLGESQLVLLAGPERIESGWWDGDDARRDYFIAGLPDGALAWVYREAGEWHLHGLFA